MQRIPKDMSVDVDSHLDDRTGRRAQTSRVRVAFFGTHEKRLSDNNM